MRRLRRGELANARSFALAAPYSHRQQEMKLALLGADPAMLSVASAAAEDGGHQMVAGCQVGAAADYLHEFWPRLPIRDDWEFLLSPGAVDGILVARSADEEQRAEQMRKLIQEGIPLLVSHPLFESMLVYYELDMIRRESGCRILPYLPDRTHPGITRLKSLIATPPGIGRLEQLSIERLQADRNRCAVIEQFSRDIDLARVLAGELTQLSALAPGETAARYSNLGVQLSGPASIPVRWSVRAAEGQPRGRLQLLGSAGRGELTMLEDRPWQLDIWQGQEHATAELGPWNAASESLADFAALVKGESAKVDWVDACRAVELADTIDRSLKRNRTIELHFEEYSEQGTFKGMMTSLGCGLLIAAILLMLLAALAARLGLPFARYWAVSLLVVLVAFLGLQAFRLVFAGGAADATDADQPAASPSPRATKR